MSFYKYGETKLYYETEGEGDLFLIIHGWAIDHRFTRNMMEPVFSKVPGRNFMRIYIDLPGMGLSEAGSVKNGDGVIEVIDNFMRDVFGDSRFYVGGNSFGAGVSRAYAAKYPDKILGLMLIVPSTGKLGKLPASGVVQKDKDFLRTLSIKERAAFSCMNAILTEPVWNRYKKQVLPSVEINEDNDFLKGKFHGTFGFDIDAAFRKKKYDRPVLILCADHDTAVGYEDQKKWLEIFANAQYYVIRDAGHNVFVDAPKEFESVVSKWIETLN